MAYGIYMLGLYMADGCVQFLLCVLCTFLHVYTIYNISPWI
jgi:hypothetical protein